MVKLVIRARDCGYGRIGDCERRFREALEGKLGQAVALYRVREVLYCFLLEYHLIDSFVKWLEGRDLLKYVYKVDKGEEFALRHYRKARGRGRRKRKS